MNLGILFDLDGTLLDTLEDLKDAVNYALTLHGCPVRSLEEVRAFVGNGAEQLIRLALPGTDHDPALSDVLTCFRRHYDAHCRVKTKPYDGILPALAALSHYPMAIVSNKPDSAVKLLRDIYFDGMAARGEGQDCPRKPAPDMLHQTMAALDVTNCIYVGDSEVDVITAKNAGVRCLCVTWGFRDKEALAAAGGVDFCDDPRDLPACIEKLAKEIER